MNSEGPTVTLGVPTFNGAATLVATIQQLAGQDFQSIEILISDNCSTDDTRRVGEELAAAFEDVRYRRLDSHVAAHRNFGEVLRHARGRYFMWASDHDFWSPTFVSECVAALDKNEAAVLAIPAARWVDAAGTAFEEIPPLPDLRGRRPAERVMALVWTLENCYPIYGMFRTPAIRRLYGDGNRYPVGFDASVLSDAAALGEFVNVPRAVFGLTRRPDYGDNAAQLRKLGLGGRGSRLRSEARLARFAISRGASAAQLVGGRLTSAMVFAGVAAGTEYRYWWLRHSY
jgi:glycosyltransferase involved in cell wall biosynthesis